VLLITYKGKKEQVRRHRPKYKSQYVYCCFCPYVSQFCPAAVSFMPGDVQNIAKCKGRIYTFLVTIQPTHNQFVYVDFDIIDTSDY
jgi:hypothetical protein